MKSLLFLLTSDTHFLKLIFKAITTNMVICKSRACVVAAGVCEILYGLSFVCMSVACSYLQSEAISSSSSPSSWAPGSANIPVWRQDDLAPYSPLQTGQLTRRDLSPSTSTIRANVAGHGTWLAILYTVTGLLAIVAGQEHDRIIPLLHTVLALVCIAWAPLMFEMVYLLVRPSSVYAYSFVHEMEIISGTKQWAAYIICIIIVVAGSAMYLFSAALAAYQYGVRVIERPLARYGSNSTLLVGTLSQPATAQSSNAQYQKSSKMDQVKHDEAKKATSPDRLPLVQNPNTTTAAATTTTSKSRTLNQLHLTLPIPPQNSDNNSSQERLTGIEDDQPVKYIKHSRTDFPLQPSSGHAHSHQQSAQYSSSASMTLPRTQQSRHTRQYDSTHNDPRQVSASRSDLERGSSYVHGSYDGERDRDRDRDRDRNRDRDRDRNRDVDWRREKRDPRNGNIYNFTHFYDNSQEATV